MFTHVLVLKCASSFFKAYASVKLFFTHYWSVKVGAK